MPTYVYECKKCGSQVETFHSISATYEECCEKCGSEMNKVFTPVGIVFKGSGFYINDSKKSTAGSTSSSD